MLIPTASTPGSPLQLMIECEASPRLPKDFGLVAQRMLLDEYGPAAVLVNRYAQHPVLFGPTANHLELPVGHPTLDLSALLRPGGSAPACAAPATRRYGIGRRSPSKTPD